MSNRGKHYQKYQIRISQGKHNGRSKEHLYGVWAWMRGRCYCPTNTGYKNYGGRGIIVCQAWRQSYESFKNWALANGYIDGLGLELDRIDVNGPYAAWNCRWVTRKENARNKRNTVYLNYNGLKKCMAEIQELTGRSPDYVKRHYQAWR